MYMIEPENISKYKTVENMVHKCNLKPENKNKKTISILVRD